MNGRIDYVGLLLIVAFVATLAQLFRVLSRKQTKPVLRRTLIAVIVVIVAVVFWNTVTALRWM